MDNRELTKKIVGYTAEYGTAIIIGAIIKNHVSVTRIDKRVAVAVATFAIAGVVAVRASRNIRAFVDEIFDGIDKIKKI